MSKTTLQRASSSLLIALSIAGPALADTASDMNVVRERRLKQVTKAPEPGTVAGLLAKMNADGTFMDLDYTSKLRNDSWGPKFQLERMGVLVGAYLAEGPDKGKPEIKAAVLKSLDAWLRNDYKNSNWWWNKIGIPNRIAPTLFAFWGDLSAEQKAKAIELLLRSKMETPLESSGTNLVWFNMVAIDRGLLTDDAAVVRKAVADIVADIKVMAKQRDGVQPDNSYLFHGSLIYTLGYGLSYLQDQARLAAMFSGTQFAFPKDKLTLVRDLTLDGAQWMTRYNIGDLAGVGRSIARHDQQDVKILAEIGRDLLTERLGRADELRDMVSRVSRQPDAKPLVGNRQFWRADMMTHQRPGWYASARLFSARTRNTEYGNGEGMRSFYVADGANMLMRDGNEYFNFMPFWDWQHIPGTTVELLPNFGPVAGKPYGANDSFNPKLNTIGRKSTETFVGGVSDGLYGAFGGKFSRDAMSVRRGWFFFDDQYVCLGSALNCTSGNAVVTTLDDRRSNGPLAVGDDTGVKIYGANATDPQAAQDHAAAAAKWLLHDGVGYAFFAPTPVRFHNGPRTGDWHDISTAYPANPEQRNVFDAWIEHGSALKDAGYAYAVYPNIDQKALAAAADAPPLTVASNTPDCQAVWHDKLGRGMAIFYSAGEVGFRPGLTVAVDRPCMAMVTMQNGRSRVTISDPENKPGRVKLTITAGGKTNLLDIELPDGPQAGSSVSRAN